MQEQLFLRSVVGVFHSVGQEEATFGEVYNFHMKMCRLEGASRVSWQPPAT